MGKSWYMDAPGDRRFNWNKDPSFVCPLGDPVEFFPRDEATGVTPAPALRDGSVIEFTLASAEMGCDAVLLAQVMRRAHTSAYAGRRRDESGKLTDDCAACGARMKRLGFRAWEDVPRTDDAAAGRIAARLGFDAPRRVLRSRYFRTKKQAEAWARAGAKAAKAKAVA